MKRTEFNISTGEVVEIAQVVYQVGGERVVLDASDPAPEGGVVVTEDELQAEREAMLFSAEVGRLQALVQKHMDDAAISLGYDDLKTAVTYADEPSVPKFQAEGQALRAWRSKVWAKCYQMLSEGGQAPSDESLIASLPPLVLP